MLVAPVTVGEQVLPPLNRATGVTPFEKKLVGYSITMSSFDLMLEGGVNVKVAAEFVFPSTLSARLITNEKAETVPASHVVA